jgi:branched-chain amino acid transport system ATP-binding protein
VTRRRRLESHGATLLVTSIALVAILMSGPNQLQIITTILVAATFALSLNVLLGLAGQVSFGHALFYGTGAYGVTLATAGGVSWLVGVAAGLVLSCLTGVLIGWAALRVRGHYLAMFTFAAGMSWYLIARQLEFTGGVNGKGVDPTNATLLGFDVTNPFYLALLALAVLTAATFGYSALRRSAFGRWLVAVRQNETLLATTGVNVRVLKLWVFVGSAGVASVAGSLFALATLYADPDSFDFLLSIDGVVMVVLGGLGATVGPWLGAAAFVGGDQLFSSWPEVRMILFGVAVLIVLLLFPRGLSHAFARLWALGGRGRVPAGGDDAAEPTRGPVGLDEIDWRRDRGPAELVVDGLSKSYGGVQALDGVAFTAHGGEIVALVGPNGAGKTTVLNCISGWTRPDAGRVEVDGRSLLGRDAIAVARLGISRTFQTPRVVGELSVLDNARLGRLRDDATTPERAEAMLSTLALGRRGAAEASKLTHGERKRLELVRVLLEQPDVILLDEPFAGLSAEEVAACIELMRAVAEQGVLVLFIDHNLQSVMRLATRIVVLDFGRVIADGAPADVQRSPDVAQAYNLGTVPEIVGSRA